MLDAESLPDVANALRSSKQILRFEGKAESLTDPQSNWFGDHPSMMPPQISTFAAQEYHSNRAAVWPKCIR
jgi:hypothetical protein